jgi:hypothetical protein
LGRLYALRFVAGAYAWLGALVAGDWAASALAGTVVRNLKHARDTRVAPKWKVGFGRYVASVWLA